MASYTRVNCDRCGALIRETGGASGEAVTVQMNHEAPIEGAGAKWDRFDYWTLCVPCGNEASGLLTAFAKPEEVAD